jgi:hypothetical protein
MTVWVVYCTKPTKQKKRFKSRIFFRIWVDICKIRIVSSEWLFSKEYPVWSGWPFWSCVYLRIGDAFDCVQRYTVGQPLTGSCLSDIIYVKNWVYLEISDIFIYGEQLSPLIKFLTPLTTSTYILPAFFCLKRTKKGNISRMRIIFKIHKLKNLNKIWNISICYQLHQNISRVRVDFIIRKLKNLDKIWNISNSYQSHENISRVRVDFLLINWRIWTKFEIFEFYINVIKTYRGCE